MIFTTLAVVASSIIGTQHVACYPANNLFSTERVILSYVMLEGQPLPEVGTLFITAGLNADGEQVSTGKLVTQLVAETPATKKPGVARYRVLDQGDTFTVSINENTIGKALASLSISVEMESGGAVFNQDYSCYASFFP